MNRRDFVSRVTLGGVAAACTGLGKPVQAATAATQVNVRFVGMMTFLERAIVRSSSPHRDSMRMHHMMHTPFLMARAGSAIAHRVRHEAGGGCGTGGV